MPPAAPPKALRWGKQHNQALHKLFAEKKADPQRLESDYINRIWNDDELVPAGSVLRRMNDERFRHHYRQKAAMWLTEKAVSGIRRSECGPSWSLYLSVIASTNILLVVLFL
jgi:hypothetical protein